MLHCLCDTRHVHRQVDLRSDRRPMSWGGRASSLTWWILTRKLPCTRATPSSTTSSKRTARGRRCVKCRITLVGTRCVSTQPFQWKYCSVEMIEHWRANKMTSISQLTGFCKCHAAVCYQVGAVRSSVAVAGSVGYGYFTSWHVWVSTMLLPHMKPQKKMYWSDFPILNICTRDADQYIVRYWFQCTALDFSLW